MKLTQIVMVAALMLPGSFAAAQDYDAEGMASGLTMIERNVAQILDDNDFDIDPRSLTLAQLVEISEIMRGPEFSGGGPVVRTQIEAALGRED